MKTAVMKAAVKAKAKAKAKATSGAAKGSASSSKGSAGKVLSKSMLKKAKLDTEESLADKVKRLAAGAATAEEAVAAVAKGLSTLDRSKIHGQHTTAVSKDPALKAEKDEAEVWL